MSTWNLARIAVPAVRALSPYVPGKPIAELERELAIGHIVKLASNENAWGTSPKAIEALHAAIADVWLYPDGSGHELKQALSRFLGVGAECLTLGNGSNELLVLLAEAYLDAASSAVHSQYGFAIYPLVIRATGAAAIESAALPPDHAMPLGHDLARMRAAIRSDTRLVFIANPNNPTGTWVTPEVLREFIATAPAHTLVVLDEAYLEFGVAAGAQDGISWVGEFPNLVLLRTFSKAYGLAGVRVGYAVSHPEVADALNRLRPAFNVSSLGLAAASAALEDQAHVRRTVDNTQRGLTMLRAGCAALGLETVPSAANFLLVHIGAATREVYDRLLRAGLIVRPVAGYGLPEYLRVTVGTDEQNQRLLAALREAIAHVGAH